MTPWLLWPVAVLSLVGTLANVHRRRWCFLLWLPANLVWVAHDALRGDWPEAALWAAYAGLAAWGWLAWGRALNRQDTKNTAGGWTVPDVVGYLRMTRAWRFMTAREKGRLFRDISALYDQMEECRPAGGWWEEDPDGLDAE